MAEFRYLVDLPFLGPFIRPSRPSPARGMDPSAPPGDESCVVTGGTDPALGEALMAAFVPVVHQAGRFAAADRQGRRASLSSVGWVTPCDSDTSRNFRIDVPVDLWRARIDGVLMVLVYDQPPTPLVAFPITGSDIPITGSEQQVELVKEQRKDVPREPVPIANLIPQAAEELAGRLDELLQAQDARLLNPAVIRMPS